MSYYNIITKRECNPPPIKANTLPRQHEGMDEGRLCITGHANGLSRAG